MSKLLSNIKRKIIKSVEQQKLEYILYEMLKGKNKYKEQKWIKWNVLKLLEWL